MSIEKGKKEQSSSSKKNDKSKKVAEEKRLKAQQAANEIEDLFKQRKKVKEEEAESILKQEQDDDSNEEKPGETKIKKNKKRDRGNKSSEGWYENEDEAALIPISDDEEGNGEPSLEYGIIKSNYKRSKIVNPEAPLERIDKTSGLPVYKAHLLKVGEGGGTPLCPFDCDCCF
eukprot:gene2253-2395_t